MSVRLIHSRKQPTRQLINYGVHVSKEATNEQNSLREILYHLWVSTVVVNAFSNLVPLQTRTHLQPLQVALNVSHSRTLVIPTDSIQFLPLEVLLGSDHYRDVSDALIADA